MDPALIIATVSVVSTIAIAFVGRGNQRSDKLEDRVGALESRTAAHDTHIDNLKSALDEIKVGMRHISDKLDKILAGK